jgi:hypothetical protein
VGQKLRQNMPEIALVWRQGLRPRVACCTAIEAVFIGQLLAGASLLAVLELLPTTPAAPFDISDWLAVSTQQGLLLGAQQL